MYGQGGDPGAYSSHDARCSWDGTFKERSGRIGPWQWSKATVQPTAKLLRLRRIRLTVPLDISRETLTTRYSPQPRELLNKRHECLNTEHYRLSAEPAGQPGGVGWPERAHK